MVVVFQPVGLDGVTNSALLDHLAVLVAFLIVGVKVLVFGLESLGAGDLIVHGHIVVPLVSAHDGHGHLTVDGLCVDADGETQGVLELEIGSRPAHSGVQAVIAVAGYQRVAGAVGNFHIGHQHAVVQSGTDLADAAAQDPVLLGADLVVGVLIALGGGALAYGIVEGEGLAGVHNGAVDGLTGQGQIGLQVTGVFIGGVVFCQNILVEHFLVEHGGGDEFHGDPDFLAVVGLVHQLLGFFQIEAVAIGAGDDFIILQIHGGIDRLDVEFVVNGLKIHRIRLGHGVQALHGDGETLEAVGVQDLFVNRIHVKVDTGGAQDDDQGLGFGGFGIEVLVFQVRQAALQTIGDLGQGTAGIGGAFVQHIQDVIFFQFQVRQQANDVGFREGIQVSLFPLGLGAGAAIVIGFVDGGFDIQTGLGVGRRQAYLGASQIHHHVQTGIGQAGGVLHGADGFVLGHAAHIYAADDHVVQNGLVIGVGRTEEEDADKQQDQHQCGTAQGQQRDFSILLKKSGGLVEQGHHLIGKFHRLFGFEFRLGQILFQTGFVKDQIQSGGIRFGLGLLGGLGSSFLTGDLPEGLLDLPLLLPVGAGLGKFTFCHGNILLFHSILGNAQMKIYAIIS